MPRLGQGDPAGVASDLAACGALDKPFDLDELFTVVGHCLSG